MLWGIVTCTWNRSRPNDDVLVRFSLFARVFVQAFNHRGCECRSPDSLITALDYLNGIIAKGEHLQPREKFHWAFEIASTSDLVARRSLNCSRLWRSNLSLGSEGNHVERSHVKEQGFTAIPRPYRSDCNLRICSGPSRSPSRGKAFAGTLMTPFGALMLMSTALAT